MKKLIIVLLVICMLVRPYEVYAEPPVLISDSNNGILTDDTGQTRQNFSNYDPNAVIKYESDTFFYVEGVNRDVSLVEIAEQTGKNFNGADTISGFKYNNPAARDAVEINDIVDTLVNLGYGNDVIAAYRKNKGQLTAVSYNNIRAYDAGTGDADSGKTFLDYSVSLKNPYSENTRNKLEAFVNDISWGDPEAVRKTALYSVSGTTKYIPELTKTPEQLTPSPVPTDVVVTTKAPVKTPTPVVSLSPAATNIVLPTEPPVTERPTVGIIYSGNGADGGTTWNTLSDYYGEFVISKNGFFKNGYHDVGYWTDDISGKGKRYSPGEKIIIKPSDNNPTIILYAQWEGNEYIVDYDYNADFCAHPENLCKGNSAISEYKGKRADIYYSPYEYRTYELLEDNALIRAGEKYKLPKPEMPGYTFIGWSFREMISGNGFWGSYCTEDMICTAASNHTLYAVWNPEKYKVGFDFNFDFGINAVSDVNAFENISSEKVFEITYGERYSYLTEPEKEGYRFCGWFTEEKDNNGTGTEITKESICEAVKNHILYAKWEPIEFKIYLEDSAKGTAEGIKTKYGDRFDKCFYAPERKGYRFVGWNEAVDGSGKYIKENDELKYIRDTHLYAIYDPIPFELKFDYRLDWKRKAVKADIRSITPVYAIIDYKAPELPKAGREGYYFNGWYIMENGKKSVISAAAKANEKWMDGLYANWIPDLVRVIYDYNEDYRYGKNREEDYE